MSTYTNKKIPWILSEAKGYKFLVHAHDEFVGMSIQNGFIYEEGLTRNMVSILPRDKNIIDIGANMGTHTVLFADHVLPGGGSVYAFEPQRIVYQQLCANIALNRLPNVYAYQLLLGHEDTVTTLSDTFYDEVFSESNNMSVDFSAERMQNFGGRSIGVGTEEVQMKKLDDFDFQNISLIKADVEGSEPLVFWGARELIARERPFIWFEKNMKSITENMQKVLSVPEELYNFDIGNFCINELGYPQVLHIGGANYMCCPQKVNISNKED